MATSACDGPKSANPKASLFASIKQDNQKSKLKKVPENEIHFVAPFDQPADMIVYEKKSAQYGDLWIGPKSATHKANHDFLKSCNVKCIISLSRTPIDEEFKLSDEIQYHYFEAKDDDDFEISALFPSIHKIIDEHIAQGNNVLVHCDMGVSRSGTIIVSYLMKTLQISCKNALELAKKSRRAIRPNEGFLKQLQQFEKQCIPNNIDSNESKDENVDANQNDDAKKAEDQTQAD